MAARGPSLIIYGQTFLFLEEVLDHADFELGRVRLESGHPFASLARLWPLTGEQSPAPPVRIKHDPTSEVVH